MLPSKSIVEPLVIILAFTTGTLVNYEPKHRKETGRKHLPLTRGESPDEDVEFMKSDFPSTLPCPNNHRFRSYPTSQFLARFPFLVEIGYWLLTYWPYQLMRAYSASVINATAENRKYYGAMALNNAARVLRFERFVGLAWERSWQQFFLAKMPWAMELMAFIYLVHICVGVSFLVYGYTFFNRASYRRVRRCIAINNWIAFVVLTVYRCAPPRLMPEEYGFVDYMHPEHSQATFSDSDRQEFDWANNTFQLKIAAMPSLHFGTACLLGFSLFKFAPVSHGILRKSGMVYPPLMFLVVVTTANHWTLDCLVGFGVVVIGWHVNWVLNYLTVVEAWVYWLFRTEKPVDTKCERVDGVLKI